MHDVNEGVIPYFLNIFFSVAIKEKVMSVPIIEKAIRDFNYGELNKRNRPKNISIERQKSKCNSAVLFDHSFAFHFCKTQRHFT